MSEVVRIEDHGTHVTVVNANAARRNALTPDYYAGLARALAEAPSGSARSVILAGEGGYFSAGGDLGVLATRAELPEEERRGKIEALHGAIRAIRDCPLPVIAAVDGGAAGAGMSIAFACDLIVAAEDATFALSYVKAGLVPDGGVTRTLALNLPRATLARLALLGDSIPAARLHALGALSVLAAPGAALAEAETLAGRIARGPADAQRAIKALLRDGMLESRLDLERDEMARAQGGAEAAEGIAAFLGKRAPDFGGTRM